MIESSGEEMIESEGAWLDILIADRGGEEMIESKGALTSKINWLGILILLTTALQDPVFADLFGSLFPAGMIDRLGYALGILVLYFRSNGEVNLPVDWKRPLSGPGK